MIFAVELLTGTGLILALPVFTGAFLTARAATFLATGFLATGAFLAGAFTAGAFLTSTFLATGFFATAFLTAFLAGNWLQARIQNSSERPSGRPSFSHS